MSILEHIFSVELISRGYVKNISLEEETREGVVFEGTLGETHEILLEEDVLEITGSYGSIRVMISPSQLQNLLENDPSLER
jgi:hypothetical protein